MSAARNIAGAILVIAGLIGIHFGVEYSGWVIALGAFVIL